VHNQVLMSVGHSLTDAHEQLKRAPHVQIPSVNINRDAIDVIHHEVWLAIVRVTGVK